MMRMNITVYKFLVHVRGANAATVALLKLRADPDLNPTPTSSVDTKGNIILGTKTDTYGVVLYQIDVFTDDSFHTPGLFSSACCPKVW